MIVLKTTIRLTGISGREITDFFLNCDDKLYQEWWPETHLAFHIIKEYPEHLGDIVLIDEHLGKYHLRMKAIVCEVLPGKKITWQFLKGIRLPAKLAIELQEDNQGIALTHILSVGFPGPGKIFDFFFRFFINNDFAQSLDEHARLEFPMLRTLLLQKTSN